jgi:lipoprotein-releasing system permease protein
MAGYEWQLALRYLGVTRRHGFVSFVAGVSMVGLALGVAVLIIVLSVLNSSANCARGCWR